MHVQSKKTSGNWNRVSGFLRIFIFSQFIAAFAFSTLHAQTRAYVTSINTNTVSVIDTSTNSVAATIPVGSGPAGVVVSPDGTTAYVSNSNDGTLSVIDTATNSVTATISTGGTPGFSAISPDGKTLFVPNNNGGVVVVDTASKSVTTTVGVGDGPIPAVVTPDGSHVYVNTVQGVFVIDASTNTVVGSPIAPSGFSAFQRCLGITPDGSHVYLTLLNGNVVVISTASNTQVANIAVPGNPAGIAFTPDGSRAYVAEGTGTGAVGIIDTATNTLEAASISIGAFPFAMAITPDGAFAYVTNFNSTASVIATATNTVVATVPVGSGPFDIAISNLNAPFASFPSPTPGSGNANRITVSGSFTLGANSQGLDFAHQPMTLTVGGFSVLVPAGSVKQVGPQHFSFSGKVNGANVTFDLFGNSPNFTYGFTIQSKNAGTQAGPNPVTVTLAIGNNSGSTTVNF